jgi:hypothetical protein
MNSRQIALAMATAISPSQFVKSPTGPTKKDRPKTVICTARPRDLATEVRDHALSLCIPTTMIGDDGAGAAPPMLRLST